MNNHGAITLLGALGILLAANIIGTPTAYILREDRKCRKLNGRTLIVDWSIACRISEEQERKLKLEQCQHIWGEGAEECSEFQLSP